MRRYKHSIGTVDIGEPQVTVTFNNVAVSTQKLYSKSTTSYNPAGNIKAIIVYNTNKDVLVKKFGPFPETPASFSSYGLTGTGPFIVEYYFKDITKIVGSTFTVSGMIDVQISNDIELIESSVFSNQLHNLTPTYNLYIPESVTTMHAHVFDSYSGALNICFSSAIPPTIGEYTFEGIGNAIVCVGNADADVYKAAWTKYADIIIDGH